MFTLHIRSCRPHQSQGAGRIRSNRRFSVRANNIAARSGRAARRHIILATHCVCLFQRASQAYAHRPKSRSYLLCTYCSRKASTLHAHEPWAGSLQTARPSLAGRTVGAHTYLTCCCCARVALVPPLWWLRGGCLAGLQRVRLSPAHRPLTHLLCPLRAARASRRVAMCRGPSPPSPGPTADG